MGTERGGCEPGPARLIYGTAYPTLGVALHWRTSREEVIVLHRTLERVGRDVRAMTSATAVMLKLPTPIPETMPIIGNAPTWQRYEAAQAHTVLPTVSLVLMRKPTYDTWLVPLVVTGPTVCWTGMGDIQEAMEELEITLWNRS